MPDDENEVVETETTPSDAAAAAQGDDARRSAAIEAGRKALAEAGVDTSAAADPPADKPAAKDAKDKSEAKEKPAATKPRAADGKFAPAAGEAEPPAEPPPPPKDPNRLAVELRARQTAQRTREAAEAEARSIREQAQRELSEARALKAELSPYQRAVELLQKDPQAGIREFAAVSRRPARELVDGLLVEGAPDPVRDVKREVEAVRAENRELREMLTKDVEQRKRAESTQAQQSMTREFLSTVAAGVEQYPYLNHVYEDDVGALVEKANRVHREYYERTGKLAEWPELAEYLEGLEVERATKYSAVKSSREVRDAKTQPGRRATGHRPISAAASTQRASGPVDPKTLTDEERRQAAIQAGELAVREMRGEGA